MSRPDRIREIAVAIREEPEPPKTFSLAPAEMKRKVVALAETDWRELPLVTQVILSITLLAGTLTPIILALVEVFKR